MPEIFRSRSDHAEPRFLPHHNYPNYRPFNPTKYKNYHLRHNTITRPRYRRQRKPIRFPKR